MRRFLSLLLCAALALCFFSGCSGGDIVRMDISGPVENLDPQFTEDSTARMILANLMEGLVVKGADGAIRPGAAERWTVSDDGLTYTFTLRENACWEGGEPVIARHFTFAFERLFAPQAPSPHASAYTVIAGAEEILAGAAGLSRLGVSALDDDTVVFQLRRPSAVFLELLADTPALPCHEDTFEESRGRYGLELEYVYSNGPFLLNRWDNTRYLYLTPNAHYGGDYPAKPQRVTLYIGREDPVAHFLDGKSEIVLLSTSDLSRIDSGKAQLLPMERTVWCIVFNGGKDIFRNALLRKALAHTVDREAYRPHLEENLTATSVFVPFGMQIDSKRYRELAGSDPPLSFDAGRGAELYAMALDALEIARMPQTVFYVPESDGHADLMGMIQQSWQQYLNVHVVLEPNTATQLEARLRSGDFRMMLMPFTPAAENPGVLLGAFQSGSGQNYFGYENALFDQLLADAATGETVEAAFARYKTAEDLLLTDPCVIPVYFETGHWAIAEGLSGVEISTFGGQILFSQAANE